MSIGIQLRKLYNSRLAENYVYYGTLRCDVNTYREKGYNLVPKSSAIGVRLKSKRKK